MTPVLHLNTQQNISTFLSAKHGELNEMAPVVWDRYVLQLFCYQSLIKTNHGTCSLNLTGVKTYESFVSRPASQTAEEAT